mgnify:CR=1 FL=1
MKNNLKNIFKFLDKNRIDYLLLRPIDFSKELTDIDLIINKLVFLRLLQLLEKSNFSVKCKYTNYRESIKLFVDHITLDIQHFVAFLPYKGLVIKENTLSAGIKIENNSLYLALKNKNNNNKIIVVFKNIPLSKLHSNDEMLKLPIMK